MPETISQKSATAIGLGAIIGAGIFVLSGTAIALAGSYALVSFVIVGIIALIVALELGELGSIMPQEKGASYSYVRGAFGSELGFITGLLLYFSYVSSVPVIALGFGAYLSTLTGLDARGFQTAFALVLIGVLAVVNMLGVSKAARTELGLVVFKVCILLLFIGFGIVFTLNHNFANYSNFVSLPQQRSIQAVFSASVAVFFAYAGFQSISTITPEVKGGSKRAARAIVSSVSISLVLYVLVALVLILLVPAKSFKIVADPISYALASSSAPSSISYLIGLGALIATTSAALAMILSSSRILYQLSADGLLPQVLGRYNDRRDVPTNGIMISALLAVPFLLLGNVFIIAAVSNFGLIFSYIMASLAVLKFRKDEKHSEMKTRLSPYLPLIAILALLTLMLGMPSEALVIGIVTLIVLMLVYHFFKSKASIERLFA
ncbi:MAG: amino acid permease [Nitrososphaerota archaeon]|nr:amino acid permease [Nitrososphaerota archaeon]